MSQTCHRLRDANAFDEVFKRNSYRVSSKAYLFLAKPNDLDSSRLGMVIGKKNIRLATRRNKVKRAIREAFRHQVMVSAHKIDLVVVARAGVETESPPLMREQIHHLMDQLLNKLANAH